jgi:hypothetical protein
LACNISAYARASKFETIIKKGKANIKISMIDIATKIKTGQVDNLTGKVK